MLFRSASCTTTSCCLRDTASFHKDRRRFQTEISTIYSEYTIELHTFTSRAQEQHIASLVCITFSYHVCFPFDAHIHYLTKETVQPSSHFQFVQHELTSNNHQQYLPVLHSGLLTATNQLSTGIKQPAHTAQTVCDCFRSPKLNILIKLNVSIKRKANMVAKSDANR